jgi:hypothetical protein
MRSAAAGAVDTHVSQLEAAPRAGSHPDLGGIQLDKTWTLPQAFSDHLPLAAEIRLPVGTSAMCA